MKKFNKSFVVGTKVLISGEYGFRTVTEIHSTRNWVNVSGLVGSFQRGDIIQFTNKSDVEMYPALLDLYVADQYGSVYQRGDTENVFIGKLNGMGLQEFINDKDDMDSRSYLADYQ